MAEDGVNAVGKGKEKKKGKGKANNGHANAVDKPPPTPRRSGAAGTTEPAGTTGAAGTRPTCSWCKKRGHTYKQCWARDPTLRPPYLQVKSVGNAHGQGNRQVQNQLKPNPLKRVSWPFCFSRQLRIKQGETERIN
jgi:hypothetical protein